MHRGRWTLEWIAVRDVYQKQLLGRANMTPTVTDSTLALCDHSDTCCHLALTS